jgi:hypothetical protein
MFKNDQKIAIDSINFNTLDQNVIGLAKNETSSYHPPASGTPFMSSLSNTVTSSDILTFAPDFSSYTPSNGKSQQQFKYNDSSGQCWNKTVTSANYTVTGTSGGSC